MNLRCTCGAVLRVGDEAAEKIVTCPECKALLQVPSPIGEGGAPPDSATQLSNGDLVLTDGDVPSEWCVHLVSREGERERREAPPYLAWTSN